MKQYQGKVVRKLDPTQFSVHREEEDYLVCFSDLTEHERDLVLANKNTEDLVVICKTLADTLYKLGKLYNINHNLNGYSGEDLRKD